ncbi:hypothetical protein TeGR_g12628, partial [Tetraparma gracilis]
YIIRGLQGKLRIGLAKSSVLVSLAHAFTLTPPTFATATPPPEGEELEAYPEHARTLLNGKAKLDVRLDAGANIIRKAHSEASSYDTIVKHALLVPLWEMHKHCSLTPGVPVEPMLAKPTKSVQEVLKRLEGQRFTLEYKYDGERVQVHQTEDGGVKCFSRNLLDTSDKFPEVPGFVRAACEDTGVTSFVIDAEVVAYDQEKDMLVPFQVLSTRKKETTLDEAEGSKVKVIVQAFDI